MQALKDAACQIQDSMIGKDLKIGFYKFGDDLKIARYVAATIFFTAWWPTRGRRIDAHKTNVYVL